MSQAKRNRREAAKWKKAQAEQERATGVCPDCGKMAHATRAQAKAVVKRSHHEHMSVYKCTSGYWHVGHLRLKVLRGDITRAEAFGMDTRSWVVCCTAEIRPRTADGVVTYTCEACDTTAWLSETWHDLLRDQFSQHTPTTPLPVLKTAIRRGLGRPA